MMLVIGILDLFVIWNLTFGYHDFFRWLNCYDIRKTSGMNKKRFQLV